MTERLVRPVRAWADYEEWSVFMDHYTGIASDERWFYEAHLIPKGANGACTGHGGFRGLVDFFKNEPKPLGPLRSLRVLYENGYEMELDADDGPFPGEWEWLVLGPGQTYQASGSFKEDKDTEAVERSLIAAAAWFTQVDSATLGIDSPLPEPVS
jgi:hypothetical protein